MARRTRHNQRRHGSRRILPPLPTSRSQKTVFIARFFDVAAWCMFLGAAAFLGVMLDRVAYDIATKLTGYTALAGAAIMFVRWGMISVKKEKR